MSKRNLLITCLVTTICVAAGVYAFAYGDQIQPVNAPSPTPQPVTEGPGAVEPAPEVAPVAVPTPHPVPEVQPIAEPVLEEERSHVDLVIALDTSSSMNGLIDGTRQKLWDIVDQLSRAEPTPVLRVGLISFGHSSYEKHNGWTRVDQNLTTDLDAVYEKLMAYNTSGGEEYVGRAVHFGRTKMDWSQEQGALKIMYVAGNESADQDRKFRAVDEAALAAKDDIHVNLIFCGADNAGRGLGNPTALSWRKVANAGGGEYASIARDGGVAVINSPYDAQLSQLGQKLNRTYVGYGALGRVNKVRQEALDKKADGLSVMSGARRAAAKGSKLYDNSSWDLLDAKKKGLSNKDLRGKGLPAELAEKSDEELDAFVAVKQKERAEIQAEIAQLNKKRRDWLADKRKREGRKDDKAVDRAMLKSLHKQAKRKSIDFALD